MSYYIHIVHIYIYIYSGTTAGIKGYEGASQTRVDCFGEAHLEHWKNLLIFVIPGHRNVQTLPGQGMFSYSEHHPILIVI